MKNRYAFTMLELIFVIVTMGIIAKFGIGFLAQSYNNFIFSNLNNTLQAKSEMAVESIAKRLQFRIKDSTIRRKSSDLSYKAIGDIDAGGSEYNILEWVGSDIDGFRGDTKALWSGVIDIDASSATTLKSPETNTTALNTLITTLSHGVCDINDSALYFIGSDTQIDNYSWDGDATTSHLGSVIHPIKPTATIDEFESGISGVDFSGVDIYEYYKFIWSAYAIVHDATTKDLTLYYAYQPWRGEKYSDGRATLLMEDVSTFRFKSVGSVLKIQVCTKSDVMEEYSLCKEKTIF